MTPSHLLYGLLALIVAAAAVFAVRVERKSRLALRRYWDRKCTGRLWRRRFPEASTASIRQFVEIIASAFRFPGRHLKLAPDDRVLDIYRAIYPDHSMPDACELEILVRLVAERHGVDIVPLWRDEITLGELYVQATTP